MFKNRGLNNQQIDYIKKHYTGNSEDILYLFDEYVVTWGVETFTDDEVKRLAYEADVTVRIGECERLFDFTGFRKSVLNITDDAWMFMVVKDTALARVVVESYKQYLDAVASTLELIKGEKWNRYRLLKAWENILEHQKEYSRFMEIIEEVERTS